MRQVEMPGAVIPSRHATRGQRPSLEDVLSRRRSVRRFTSRPLTDDEVLRLCWAAQGITHADGYRTAPSAGALYPLELGVATADGFWTYDPFHHRLVLRSVDDLRVAMRWAAGGDAVVGENAAVFTVAAVPTRTTATYGSRGQRYVHLEAGHAAQNLLLEATALGLGATTVASFDDARLREVLDLPGDREMLYLVPVGEPG